MRSTRRQSPRVGWACEVSVPQSSQGSGRPIVSPLNAQMSGDALPQFVVHGDHSRLTIEGHEIVPLGELFKFLLDLGLIQDERLKQIVGKGEVPPRLPVADRVRLAKLALERR